MTSNNYGFSLKKLKAQEEDFEPNKCSIQHWQHPSIQPPHSSNSNKWYSTSWMIGWP